MKLTCLCMRRDEQIFLLEPYGRTPQICAYGGEPGLQVRVLGNV